MAQVMKLALIPPFDGLHIINERDNYHLMLPQLLDNELYATKYRELRRRGDFIILDNGAAEGELVSDEKLVALTRAFDPDEVVIPDIMGDALGTIGRATKFVKAYGSEIQADLMFVAQGRSLIEVTRMIEVLVTLDHVTTVGIPRHLLATTGHKDVRIMLAMWIHKHYGKTLNIHFLGAAPSWPFEVLYANDLKFVRGMDTSMPFNYALNNAYLVEGDKKHIKRPLDYFNQQFTHEQEILARRNAVLMRQWATTLVSAR